MKSKPMNSPARAVAWRSDDVNRYLRRILGAAGQDPSAVVDGPFRLLRLAEVLQIVGLSERSLYRRISLGEFPRGIPIDSAASAAAARAA